MTKHISAMLVLSLVCGMTPAYAQPQYWRYVVDPVSGDIVFGGSSRAAEDLYTGEGRGNWSIGLGRGTFSRGVGLVACIRHLSSAFRAGHPAWRRCSSFKYSRYSQSSRLASRAPRSEIRYSTDRYRPLGTTLSYPQLMKPLFGLLHPLHVSGATDKQQPGEDFLDEGPRLRKREPRSRAGPHPFGLQETHRRPR